MQQYQGVIGLAVLIGLAALFSNNRAKIRWSLVVWGLALQFAFALLILKTPVGRPFFSSLNTAVTRVIQFTDRGTYFVFGPLNDRYTTRVEVVSSEAAPPLPETSAGELIDDRQPAGVLPAGSQLTLESRDGKQLAPPMVSLAFALLPSVIFLSGLLSILYYIGLMQWVVRGIAWVMQRTMKTSGAETFCVAGNIFVGQTEAPLMIRPYLPTLTHSELLTVMTAGFATIAGGVLVFYTGILQPHLPGIAGHLMAASVMSAPAAIVIAKLLAPETEQPKTLQLSRIENGPKAANVVDAFGDGVIQGLQLVLTIAAMLIAFVTLVALVNGLLGLIPTGSAEPLTLQSVFGLLLRPLAWCLGIPWEESAAVGTLLGEKLVLTELYAYLNLSTLQNEGLLSERSATIAAYALCGFANFASVGVQLGGIGGMAPERRPEISRLVIRAMLGGAAASGMTACIAGMLM